MDSLIFFSLLAATLDNNLGKPFTNSSDLFTSPHDTGVGEISPHRALHPGLVFETPTEDYLNFLCCYGYSEKNIKAMSKTKFKCPKASIEDLISNVNYPSISIGKLDRHGPIKTVKRTVTNVGPTNSTYTAIVRRPKGLIVKVDPKNIVFNGSTKRVSYNVSFFGKEARPGYNFGSVTWSDGRHHVRTVFSVNVE